MSATAEKVQAAPLVANIIGGKAIAEFKGKTLPLTSPVTGELIGEIPLSTRADVDSAVAAAEKVQPAWGAKPLKDRVQVLFRLKALVERDIERLAESIRRENGKTMDEARASVARGVECIEYGTSLPQVAAGQVLQVSRGVECKVERYPLGIVAGITPFNFPIMVPLWMIPMAIGLGNAFILKPSEQTPLGAQELARLLEEAGLPPGIFSVVNGGKDVVEAICDHPKIRAVGFVGSSKVAKLVHQRCATAGKKVRAMGGAKNHLVLLPDADAEMAATNIVASATGCAGQRCMAASVLIAVGDVDHVIKKVQEKMGAMKAGKDFGPVISPQAKDRIRGYVERAEAGGAKVLLDGRDAIESGSPDGGYYVGPSIIDNAKPSHEAACDEIFGPTLTIIRCKTLDEALEIENENPYGNAAAIYTASGHAAQIFSDRASAGMIGVNIGVPVPREPFPFGGWNESAFGDGDITGPGAIDFWTRSKKITTKWQAGSTSNWMS